ncbi:tetratricopeptide repeat protein [Lentzea waywayandensis]|uniref:tetratricopeptide repeat protein n=1 Tax=Lentzea waywayandensis TaxID=84724 RepID=UPI0015A53D16|nr:tetratricopeptide repeat protein [Lentzea waywayandensis]
MRRSLALAEHADDRGGQAHTHYVFTWVWQRLGDDQQALAHALQALQLFEAIDDPVGKAVALNATGWHHARLGNYDQALGSCEQALTLARQHDNGDCEADALKSLGFIAHHTGRNADAVGSYRTELQIRQDIGDMYEEANALDHLAQAHALLSHHRDATHLWRRAGLLPSRSVTSPLRHARSTRSRRLVRREGTKNRQRPTLSNRCGCTG